MAKEMPSPDESMKDLLEDNEIFADLFNAYAFHGENVLKAEELLPADTAYADALETTKGIEKIGKYRDKVRKTALGAEFVIFAVEDQNKVHYAEPVKVMLYDALSYTAECKTLEKVQENVKWTADEYLSRTKKGTTLTPVFTLVLYTGEKPWDGPKSLYDMLRIDERLKPFVPDHSLNLLDLGHDANLRYKTAMLQDLTAALQAVYRRDFEYDGMIGNKALSLAGILANDKDLYAKANENEGGVTRMCDALKELRELGRAEGEAEGRAETIFMLVKEGLLTTEIGADKLELSPEEFHINYEKWLEMKPE